MAKLTKTEQRLLDHPPTRGTWLCRAKKMPTAEGAKVACDTPNSEKARRCWLCGTAKPKSPKLIWPVYVAVCRKAGVATKGGDS